MPLLTIIPHTISQEADATADVHYIIKVGSEGAQAPVDEPEAKCHFSFGNNMIR